MERQADINIHKHPADQGAVLGQALIIPFYRVHVDHQHHVKFLRRIPFDPVYDLMGIFRIIVTWNLCMDRSHTVGRTIIMDDQVMGSQYSFIAFYKIGYFLINLRFNGFSDQRRQRIFCNIQSAVHNSHGNCQTYNAINIPV